MSKTALMEDIDNTGKFVLGALCYNSFSILNICNSAKYFSCYKKKAFLIYK